MDQEQPKRLVQVQLPGLILTGYVGNPHELVLEQTQVPLQVDPRDLIHALTELTRRL